MKYQIHTYVCGIHGTRHTGQCPDCQREEEKKDDNNKKKT